MKKWMKASILSFALGLSVMPALSTDAPTAQAKSLKDAIPSVKDTIKDTIKDSVTNDSSRAEAYFEDGQRLFQQHYFEKAMEAYDNAILLNPKNADYYAARGNLYYNIGSELSISDIAGTLSSDAQLNFSKSVDDYTKAISLNSKTVSYYQARGIAYTELTEFDKALADFAVVIKSRPNDYTIYDRRAKTYIEKGDYNLAIQDLDHAKELNPKENIFNDYYRGIIFERQGNLEQALQVFDTLTSQNPWFAKAWLFKGIIYEKMNRPYDAIDAYGQFQNRDREHNQALLNFVNSRLNVLSNPNNS